jgi:hypothetical protein
MIESKSRRVLLGVLSVAPVVYFFTFLTIMFSAFLRNLDVENVDPTRFRQIFASIFVLHVVVMALGFALTIYYLVLVFRSKTMEQWQKMLWGLLLFFGNIFVLPIFFFVYIWRRAGSANEVTRPTHPA